MSLSNSIRCLKLLIQVAFLYLRSALNFLYCWLMPPELKSLNDEVILIVGSCSLLGVELSKNLAKTCKATLVLSDMDEKLNEELVNEIKQLQSSVRGCKVDWTNLEHIQQAFNEIRNEVGDVSTVFYALNETEISAFVDSSEEAVVRSIHFNYNIVAQTLRQLLPPMVKNNRGHIVCCTSIVGKYPVPFTSLYSASNNALDAFIQALRLELYLLNSQSNVRITSVYLSLNESLWNETCSAKSTFGVDCSFGSFNLHDTANAIIRAVRANKEYVHWPKMPVELKLLRYLPLDWRKILWSKFLSEVEVPGSKTYCVK